MERHAFTKQQPQFLFYLLPSAVNESAHQLFMFGETQLTSRCAELTGVVWWGRLGDQILHKALHVVS